MFKHHKCKKKTENIYIQWHNCDVDASLCVFKLSYTTINTIKSSRLLWVR